MVDYPNHPHAETTSKALETAISTIDTDITILEELEINLPTQDPKTSKAQIKPKPDTKLLYGGIPADTERPWASYLCA